MKPRKPGSTGGAVVSLRASMEKRHGKARIHMNFLRGILIIQVCPFFTPFQNYTPLGSLIILIGFNRLLTGRIRQILDNKSDGYIFIANQF
jgi:hypothetical protein